VAEPGVASPDDRLGPIGIFGQSTGDWVGATHLPIGYCVLGVLLARRPELTEAD
jgi:hypothetical protein